MSKPHHPAWVKKGCVLLRLELWPQCSKNQLQNSNTNKNKNYLNVKATFTDRTLNRIGQLQELTASAIDHNIDIVCIQEHRYYHSEENIKYHNTGNGWTFVSSAWKNSVNDVIGCINMLISLQTLKSQNSIEKIQPRIMVAMFNSNSSTMIICYSIINASDEMDRNAFYNDLSSL